MLDYFITGKLRNYFIAFGSQNYMIEATFVRSNVNINLFYVSLSSLSLFNPFTTSVSLYTVEKLTHIHVSGSERVKVGDPNITSMRH